MTILNRTNHHHHEFESVLSQGEELVVLFLKSKCNFQTRTSCDAAAFEIQWPPNNRERSRFVAERRRTRHERASATHERQLREQLDCRVRPRDRLVANGDRTSRMRSRRGFVLVYLR